MIPQLPGPVPWWAQQNPGAPANTAMPAPGSYLQHPVMGGPVSPFAPYGGYHPVGPMPPGQPAVGAPGMPPSMPSQPGPPIASPVARPTPDWRLPSPNMPPANFQVPGRFAFPSLHALL